MFGNKPVAADETPEQRNARIIAAADKALGSDEKRAKMERLRADVAASREYKAGRREAKADKKAARKARNRRLLAGGALGLWAGTRN